MSDLRIETLEFSPPNETTLAAMHLLMDEFASLEEEDSQEEWIKQELKAGEHLNGHTYYGVTTNNDEVLAVAELASWPEVTTVYSIAVKHDHRHNGIGTMLMKHIAAVAQERGDSLIELYSVADGFYKKLGFIAVDPEEDASQLSATPADILAA